jgi:HNH endonuclease/AP2 domain
VITQSELKELLEYDTINGGFIWKQPRSNRVKIGDKAGCLQPHGYTSINISKKYYLARRLVWLYHFGVLPSGTGETIDHIDMNRSNNKVENLRLCTRSDNQNNSGKHIDNTSGFKGVHLHRKTGKWCAQVGILGKKKYLGLFSTPEEASLAYNNYVKTVHGEFYRDTTKQ